jgi:8-oxo-dGTP pyrophosphatase MutT (NUDIX family)
VTDDEPDRCTRGHGLCVTDDGLVVVIRDADGRWELPGGGREPGETTVDAFVREVEEEACATVTAVAVVCTLRIVELDEHGAASSAVDVHAQLWARVEPAPWEPRFETTARRLVTPDEAVVITTFPHHTAALLDRAVSIDPALDWKPTTGADR